MKVWPGYEVGVKAWNGYEVGHGRYSRDFRLGGREGIRSKGMGLHNALA